MCMFFDGVFEKDKSVASSVIWHKSVTTQKCDMTHRIEESGDESVLNNTSSF